MNRFFTLILLLIQLNLSAQISWITDCADKNFCFNQGSCTEGNVFMAEKAVTACFGNPIINYSYKIDLFNDGSTEINSTQDTVTGSFPVGTHKISWRATDNCANIGNCTYLFTIKDCQAPNILCINSITQNVTPGCTTTFDVDNFIINVSDNCTPVSELVFGIRKTGDGMGFPAQTSLTFDGCDAGPHAVEIWVKDENNLSNKCFSSLEVQDNDNICGCAVSVGLQGCVRTADSLKMNNYTIRAELIAPPPAVPIQKNTTDSCYSETFTGLPLNTDYQFVIRARRNDDPLNGVSTFDLLQTSKHILNIQPFQNAYQRLAADVNASNSVTTFDVVETRKLILGLYDTFPAVQSWRLVRPVADPSNLLSAVKDTYLITLTNLNADTTLSGLDFVAVKMGDTNLSASFSGDGVDDRASILLSAEDRLLAAGETVSVPIRLAEAAHLSGWQAALSVDPALARIEAVEGLPEEDFSILKNEVRTLWFHPKGRPFIQNEVLFTLKIKALQLGSLSEALSIAAQKFQCEAYVFNDGSTEQRHLLAFGFSARREGNTAFFPPRPNPFDSETTFGLLLPKPGYVHLEVFDVSGNKVFEQKTETGAGRHSLVLRAADIPGIGVYFYRIRSNSEVFCGRLLRG
ncbi:MAG: T9SS C-terminal target domain-containing protein [Haliscomenobacteraceae bacterium CHB4]|nr:hypothetical protein [Saprospiraceae bacterium]MCE7924157.1 T9SS C-terminal target domain-containing protein [Haliscomenobacteraceae bacterium CHB4]